MVHIVLLSLQTLQHLGFHASLASQNVDESGLLFVWEGRWELNLELEDEVASLVVHHEWGERIVVVNWHSFAREAFLELRSDDVVRSKLDDFTFESLKFNGSCCKCVSKADLMSVDEVISTPSDALMLHFTDRD